MTTRQKRRLLLYGFLLSAVHFTCAALARNAGLLMLRSEDMIGTGATKPYWPPSPLADTLGKIGAILRLPFDWVWTPWMDDHVPYVIGVLLFAATSCLWGFTLAALFRFLFTRLGFRHEPRVA